MTKRGWPAWMRASEIVDLLRLSGPIAVSRASVMMMALTDAIMLGQFAHGELTFVLNSWLPMGVALGFSMGILLGVQVLTSELMGVGQEAHSGRIFRRGLKWSIALGIAVTAICYISAEPLFRWVFIDLSPNDEISQTLTREEIASATASVTRVLALGLAGFTISTVLGYYLEALRRPLIVTAVMWIGVLVNLVLDLALVAGWWAMPQMGAEGVAWATTGSRWAITIALFIAVIWFTPAFKPSQPGPEAEAKRQLTVGIGTAVSNVAEWGGFNLTYLIATWVSLAVNTAYGYSVQIMGMAFMLFLGIGTATSVRVAEAFGRGDLKQVKEASRLGVAATVVSGVVVGLFVICFNDFLAGVLVDEDKAIIDGVAIAPLIATLLITAAFAILFDGLQAVASMAQRAQEIVWIPSLIHIGSFFVIMLPAGYYLGITLERGAQGMIEAAFLGVFIAGTLQILSLEMKMARHP